MLTASTAAHSPKTAWIQHACASRDHADQRGAVSRRFPKKVSGPPILRRSKRGAMCGRVKNPISENLLASCTPPFRTFPRVRYGRAQHRHFPYRRYGRMHGWDATQAMLTAGRAQGRAHGNPHRWRRRWHVRRSSLLQPIAPPRCGCGSGVRYDLRK